MLRICLTKSDFLVSLNGLAEFVYDPANVEIKVIEGTAFVNIYASIASNTNGKYCDMELKPNEEDSHMVAHFIDASKRRVKHALVATVDSDMVEVLKKSFLFTFKALWIEMRIQRHI